MNFPFNQSSFSESRSQLPQVTQAVKAFPAFPVNHFVRWQIIAWTGTIEGLL